MRASHLSRSGRGGKWCWRAPFNDGYPGLFDPKFRFGLALKNPYWNDDEIPCRANAIERAARVWPEQSCEIVCVDLASRVAPGLRASPMR
jgi:hypothetical protein